MAGGGERLGAGRWRGWVAQQRRKEGEKEREKKKKGGRNGKEEKEKERKEREREKEKERAGFAASPALGRPRAAPGRA